MTITRLPILTSIDPEDSGAGGVTNGSLSYNAIYNQYPDGRVYATQRPALSIREAAEWSSFVAPAGRGIVYWDAVNIYYLVNDNRVYQGGYSAPLTQEISHGRDPVTCIEIGSYLVILDAENNEGWYLHESSPTILTKITDTDFPGNIPNVQIAAGGASLDGTLYVMDTRGIIYGSELNDPTVWDPLNQIGVEREQDTGVFLTKHHDHLVAMGVKSIEFFFNAANPVGSPLERRSDISYRAGAINTKCVFNTGDRIYFLGSERTGTIGVFQIVQFVLQKVSDDAIDTYLSVVRSRTKFDFLVSGCTMGDHQLMFVTSIGEGTGTGYQAPGNTPVSIDVWLPQYTLVFDGTYQTSTNFRTTIAGQNNTFPVIGATERSSVDERETSLMFFSGDVGFFDLTFARLDSAGAQEYVDPDYIVFQDDYVQDIGQDETAPILFVLRFGESDFGSVTNKFGYRLSVVGTTTSSGVQIGMPEGNYTSTIPQEPIKIYWTDDHYRSWIEPRDLQTGLNRSLTRLGTFRRRAHQLNYSGQEILRIEALELDIRASQYA